jgi:LPXTG-site transpeptidase (sortase) family protein
MTDNWEIKNEEEQQKNTAKVIRVLLSTILGIAGIVILVSQLVPLSESYLKGEIIRRNEESLASPVPGAYKREIEGQFAYWDPSASYFENLIDEASLTDQRSRRTYDPDTGSYSEVDINENYSKGMKVTIESLGIDGVHLSPNVESYDEKVYNKVLKNGLAHFKGTPLPGDGGNAFIYGHSAVESYFSTNQDDPETIFTRLEDTEIGDMVEVEKDGKIYKYRVRKKKIVNPDDFSILGIQGNKETVTLMTCHPAGIGTNRLIVIAERDG